MALGMGIGFENNVPLGQMKKGLGQALKTLEGPGKCGYVHLWRRNLLSEFHPVRRQRNAGIRL